MKKVLLSLLLALVAVSANAQLYNYPTRQIQNANLPNPITQNISSTNISATNVSVSGTLYLVSQSVQTAAPIVPTYMGIFDFDALTVVGNTYPAANTVYYTPFRVTTPISFNNIGLRTVGSATGGSIKYGIYSHNYSTNRPAIRIGATAGVSVTGANGIIWGSVGSTTLRPGIYWGASVFAGDVTPTVAGFGNTVCAFVCYMGDVSSASIITANTTTAYSEAAAYSTGLPATASSTLTRVTANGVPVLFYTP